ncbi:two-component regulator propeller domain-containing protein [Algibacter sp. L3A6]|uniref:ligand-binding sensor domain-containing protein n=1 Tax=Algibacter sp. L3A6 TaxID=2686366 RepID=UPI00131A94BA|nr:two-component regulator propeller domain-containing protein [Algibacter sp. L3A6]
MKIRIIQLLILLFASVSYAQQKQIKLSNQRIEAFNSEQGFYQNTIHSIISDNNGYLWVATPNGLVRYDGYSFDYYYHNIENKNALPNNFISSLLNDSKGRLWIGTRGGICIYLTDKEEFIPVEHTIKKEVFIKEDDKKRIWIGGLEKIEIFDASSDNLQKVDKIGEISLTDILKGNVITDVEFLSNSELLVSTSHKIFKIVFNQNDNYSHTVLEVKLDANIKHISEIIKINNSIWLGTQTGLYQTFYENNQLIKVGDYFIEDSKNTAESFDILSLFLDKDSNL